MNNEPQIPSFEALEEEENRMISTEVDDKTKFTQIARNEIFPLLNEAIEIQKQIDALSIKLDDKKSKIEKLEENYTLVSSVNGEQNLNQIYEQIYPTLRFNDLKDGNLSDLIAQFSLVFGENFDENSFAKRLKIENIKQYSFSRHYGMADILFDGKPIIHYNYVHDTDESTRTGEFHKMFITLALEYGVKKLIPKK